MFTDLNIPVPFQFNPLKHHLSFIRDFISIKLADEDNIDKSVLVKEVKHIGSCVMDVYSGVLTVKDICREIKRYLIRNRLNYPGRFSEWSGTGYGDYKVVELSDTSRWTLKFYNDRDRFVHIFPARKSPHSFRIKANTLKSAIIYFIVAGKDFISREDLNNARKLLGLSPVKTTADAEAITEMIEIIRYIHGTVNNS